VSVIYLAFTTLDGIVSDPDGRQGTPAGGWMFQFGPEAVTGDKFRLGPIFDTGVMLLGRTTWQAFGQLWPTRDDDFSRRMNAIPKLVASRTLTDASAWSNSTVLEGDLVDVVKREPRDVVVTGSLGVVEQLRIADLVDEYRLITFPAVVGEGDRLFAAGAPADFRFTAVESIDSATLTVLRRDRGGTR